jgi:hypothetical protein
MQRLIQSAIEKTERTLEYSRRLILKSKELIEKSHAMSNKFPSVKGRTDERNSDKDKQAVVRNHDDQN